MNTNLPKVMQPLGGQTLISHVINTAQQNSKNITVVVGHQKALLKEHIATIDPQIQKILERSFQKNMVENQEVLNKEFISDPWKL